MSAVWSDPIDYAAAALAVGERLRDARSQIDRTIADGDQMYGGELGDYLSVTHSALAHIGHAMAVTGATDLGRILDLPCGHGRVLRGLRAAFPLARITACDILADGVDFCAAQFGAQPVYSNVDPHQIELDEDYDLIWVGSLFTHLDLAGCLAFLELFRERLAPRGLLLFSTHGREAVRRWRNRVRHAPAENQRLAEICDGFQEVGYGYRDHPDMLGYGTSACTASRMTAELYRYSDLTLIGYAERGLADHQDLVTLVKLDAHHPQGAMLLG